jgi:hypothetical protein
MLRCFALVGKNFKRENASGESTSKALFISFSLLGYFIKINQLKLSESFFSVKVFGKQNICFRFRLSAEKLSNINQSYFRK